MPSSNPSDPSFTINIEPVRDKSSLNYFRQAQIRVEYIFCSINILDIIFLIILPAHHIA